MHHVFYSIIDLFGVVLLQAMLSAICTISFMLNISCPIIGQKGESMKTIEKKIFPKYFKDIKDHGKCFEIRKDNDNIQVGDTVVLLEWDGKKYTGAKCIVTVRYVLRNVPEYGLKDGYCIFCWNVKSIVNVF